MKQQHQYKNEGWQVPLFLYPSLSLALTYTQTWVQKAPPYACGPSAS